MSGPVAVYNEIDPYAAAWLSNLAGENRIAPGRVVTRSIVDLRPADLDGCSQFHAFAGIGGWSLALRLAGVPDDFPVWTGSCPCQPFSAAGQQRGFADDRHLWPAWFELIRECRPAIVFGEQVEAAVRLGWLDAVFADLEAEGYACGAAVLGAHSVGAPHIRQRLWFVAYAGCERGQRWPSWGEARRDDPAERHEEAIHDQRGSDPYGMADASGERSHGLEARAECGRGAWSENRSADGIVGHAYDPRLEGRGLSERECAGEWIARPANRNADFWSGAIWLPCRDGKARPTQPGLQPLAHGIPGRVGKLRAAGNAIVPQVAAAFVADCLAILSPAPSSPAQKD